MLGGGVFSFYFTVETQAEIFPLAREAAPPTVPHSLLAKMCSSMARLLLGVGWRGRRTSLDPAAHLRVEELLLPRSLVQQEVENWLFLCVLKLVRAVSGSF